MDSPSRDGGEARTTQRLDTRIEQALSREPIAPGADEEFRQELRRTFVEGVLDREPDDRGEPLLQPAGPVAGDGGPPASRSRVLRFLLPVAAAAAIFFVSLMPTAPRWRVEFHGDGPVSLDGARFQRGDEERLGALLGRSGNLMTEETALTLRLDTGLEVRVRPRSDVLVAELDPDAPLFFDLADGELFFTTEEDYRGSRIRISSDLAEVDVVGTTLGVMRYDQGFCVCVSRGVVAARDARAAEGEWRDVVQGRRFHVPTDERLAATIDPQHSEDEHYARLVRFSQE